MIDILYLREQRCIVNLLSNWLVLVLKSISYGCHGLGLMFINHYCLYLLSHPFVLAKVEQLLVLLLCVCIYHCLCLCLCLLSQSVGVGIISQEVVSVAVQSCIRQLVRTRLACSLAHLLNTAMSSPLRCCQSPTP